MTLAFNGSFTAISLLTVTASNNQIAKSPDEYWRNLPILHTAGCQEKMSILPTLVRRLGTMSKYRVRISATAMIAKYSAVADEHIVFLVQMIKDATLPSVPITTIMM